MGLFVAHNKYMQLQNPCYICRPRDETQEGFVDPSGEEDSSDGETSSDDEDPSTDGEHSSDDDDDPSMDGEDSSDDKKQGPEEEDEAEDDDWSDDAGGDDDAANEGADDPVCEDDTPDSELMGMQADELCEYIAARTKGFSAEQLRLRNKSKAQHISWYRNQLKPKQTVAMRLCQEVSQVFGTPIAKVRGWKKSKSVLQQMLTQSVEKGTLRPFTALRLANNVSTPVGAARGSSAVGNSVRTPGSADNRMSSASCPSKGTPSSGYSAVRSTISPACSSGASSRAGGTTTTRPSAPPEAAGTVLSSRSKAASTASTSISKDDAHEQRPPAAKNFLHAYVLARPPVGCLRVRVFVLQWFIFRVPGEHSYAVTARSVSMCFEDMRTYTGLGVSDIPSAVGTAEIRLVNLIVSSYFGSLQERWDADELKKSGVRWSMGLFPDGIEASKRTRGHSFCNCQHKLCDPLRWLTRSGTDAEDLSTMQAAIFTADGKLVVPLAPTGLRAKTVLSTWCSEKYGDKPLAELIELDQSLPPLKPTEARIKEKAGVSAEERAKYHPFPKLTDRAALPQLIFKRRQALARPMLTLSKMLESREGRGTTLESIVNADKMKLASGSKANERAIRKKIRRAVGQRVKRDAKDAFSVGDAAIIEKAFYHTSGRALNGKRLDQLASKTASNWRAGLLKLQRLVGAPAILAADGSVEGALDFPMHKFVAGGRRGNSEKVYLFAHFPGVGVAILRRYSPHGAPFTCADIKRELLEKNGAGYGSKARAKLRQSFESTGLRDQDGRHVPSIKRRFRRIVNPDRYSCIFGLKHKRLGTPNFAHRPVNLLTRLKFGRFKRALFERWREYAGVMDRISAVTRSENDEERVDVQTTAHEILTLTFLKTRTTSRRSHRTGSILLSHSEAEAGRQMDRVRGSGKLQYRDSALQFINAMPMPSILGEELILRISKETGEILARKSAPHMPLYSFVEIYERLFGWVADVHGFNILPKADYFNLTPLEIISIKT